MASCHRSMNCYATYFVILWLHISWSDLGLLSFIYLHTFFWKIIIGGWNGNIKQILLYLSEDIFFITGNSDNPRLPVKQRMA